jgi:acyl carrier protein
VVWLEQLPTTPSGKVDHGALPEPEGREEPEEGPQGEVERAVASIWREVLEVEEVGRHDSFFDLGGHSLLAIRLIHRLTEEFGIDVPVRQIFETHTVAGLAEYVEALQWDTDDAGVSATAESDDSSREVFTI